MNTPAIIGLTLNYRDAVRTVKCVRSLLEDGVPHVLVWDNSADEGASAAALRELLDGESHVSIEPSPANLGFAAGVNRGLAWIRARLPACWVLLINNDAVLLPGATVALAAALGNTAQAVIAYPTVNHSGHPMGTAYYQRHLGLITFSPLPGSIPFASGCCQLLAPERLDGAWFDEDFFMYGEDVELSWRLGPTHMVHVPEVWVKHEGSVSSGMATMFYETQLVASHRKLARKLARNRLELALLNVGRAFTLTLRALLRAWRYRSLAPIKSLGSSFFCTEK